MLLPHKESTEQASSSHIECTYDIQPPLWYKTPDVAEVIQEKIL